MSYAHYRLFGGGESACSPAAFLFAPSPITSFVRSDGTGVPSFDDGAGSATLAMREKPGRGAGEPVLVATGAGLPFCVVGAGSVMNPLASSCGVDDFAAFFFFLVFSVLPFDSGCASRNSAA